MKSKVKKIMKDKGVTVRSLKQDHGLNFQTIVNAGHDEKILKCQLGTLVKVAEALGVKTKDLYNEDDQETTD